jgi:hypothetical protein
MRNTISTVTLAISIWAGVCAASSPAPYYFERRTVDRIFQTAMKEPSKQHEALEALELIGVGRMDRAAPDLEARIGLEPQALRAPAFSAASVRAHALRKIGETALPEAMSFLAALKVSDLAADATGTVWSAAQIALRDVRLRRLSDSVMQARFLEEVIAEPHDAAYNSGVTLWATDELCNRGALLSLSVVQKALRHAWSGQSGEDEVQFCEARIRAVISNPDRLKAIASVLDAQGDIGDVYRGDADPRRRLLGWAIAQLNSMQSAAADAELDRFARQIDALPEGPRKAGLAWYRQDILEMQAQRAAR